MSDDEATIQSGIKTVKDILMNHFVHRNESELVKSTIKEKGRHKVIDTIVVELSDGAGIYEASFSNLGLKRVPVDSSYIKKHPKLLVNNATGKIGLVGYWDCVCFDEFAGKDKKVDKNLVDIMKNYMAN